MTTAIVYKQSKRHRKVMTMDIADKTVKQAVKFFTMENPNAVIIAATPKTECNCLGTLSNILYEAELMRNAYFWAPPMSAGCRRSYEEQHSFEEVTWWDDGYRYTAEFKVTCSCKNIYVRGNYTKDGKKTTLTAIKKSYERLTTKGGRDYEL